MRSRLPSPVLGVIVLVMLLGAGCYPFQGDISLLLTPAPSAEVDTVAVGEAVATAGANSEDASATAPEATDIAVTINTRSLRVRQGPGTDTPIVAGLRQGDAVTAVGRSADATWIQVQVPDVETLGWIAAEFVTEAEAVGSLPVTDGTEPLPTPTLAAEETATESEQESAQDATPATTPEAETGTSPAVRVGDQEIVDDTVSVDEVIAAEPGWIVIHADDGGTFGPVIGQAPVTEGNNLDVVVEIDGEAVTETLYAMLHVDAGEAGVYEFPGVDGPVLVEGRPVSPAFAALPSRQAAAGSEATPTPAPAETPEGETTEPTPVATPEASPEATSEATPEADEEPTAEATPTEAVAVDGSETELDTEPVQPRVTTSDQVLGTGNGSQIFVDEVVAAQDGWIVVHADDDGAPGSVLGQAAVVSGTNEIVVVDLGENELEAGTTLWAMLHIDAGEPGVYEFPGPDAPVTLEDAVVVQPFAVVLPRIRVDDQATVGNTITLAEVLAAQDSWVVIHQSDDEGTVRVPENIGLAPIAPGTTPNVTVELGADVAAGEVLWAMLYYDRGTTGEYEYPGADIPITLDGTIIVTPFTITGVEEGVAAGEEGATTDGGAVAVALAEVDTRSLRVRAEPNLDAEIIAGANRGEFYAVVDRTDDGEWIALVLPETAQLGWVSAELVILSAVDGLISVTGTATVQTDESTRLRVRDRPTTEGEIVGRIRHLESYPVVAQTDDKVWTLLNVPDLPGPNWVATEFITIE